jgi:hypothetical protein
VRLRLTRLKERSMRIDPAEEEIFILSDEIIDHIRMFLLRPDNHDEKAIQSRIVLRAVIHVVGIMLSEIDCPHCWESTIKAAERSFAEMLRELPAIRDEGDSEQSVQSIR